MDELRSKFLFEVRVRHGEPMIRYDAGDGGRGARSLVPAADGTFEGPYLRGELLPPLPDYLVQRGDGVIEHDIRAVLRTDDGATVYMEYTGMGHRQGLGPLDEADAAEALYFRTIARFETGAAQYQWLNRLLAVGVFQPAGAGAVGWRFYAIL
jgi:hypothetical protein